MTTPWKANQFKVAINMAGAVSAGAYAAGVLDFLTQALEEWEKAKTNFHTHLSNPVPTGAFANPVPLHDVSIEAFSGASAGGMCAAIASVMIQGPFDHVTNPQAQNTNNTFYESWVNQIDIAKLLTTNDLKNGPPISLLDSTIIDEIAKYALTPGTSPSPPSYISKELTLFLTLTNVRGVPYKLYADPSPDVDEFITYYADRIRFEVTQPGAAPSYAGAKPLPRGQPQAGAWSLLQMAAKATGAFPLFLAPRRLTRDPLDYAVPGWVPICGPNPLPPITSEIPPPLAAIDTLNVDGGVTDNDPFDLAHDFLAGQNPKKIMQGDQPTNPRAPGDANCAVISVAPFPSADRYDPSFDFSQAQGIFSMLRRLVTVLISQSRFLGESLAVAASGPVFSRFVIAPSDDGKANGSALQCGRLGAFGGFMERSFRAHDFLLGRRNCQKFLKSYFLLPTVNPIMAAGQTDAGAYAPAIQQKFASGAPPGVSGPAGAVWMPVIPLVGTAFNPIASPARGIISKDAVTKIATAIISRFSAIKSPLLAGAPAAWLLKLVVGMLCTWPTSILIRGRIVDAITKALEPDVSN
jgi:predicted acylesterase/phospholipase RssA